MLFASYFSEWRWSLIGFKKITQIATQILSRLAGSACQIVAGSLCIVLCNLSSSSSYAMSRNQEPDFASIGAYVAAQMQSDRIPGLALGIVQGNKVVHLRGFGKANPGGQPVTPQTSFILGSVSKSFTSLATMQLVEQGKISLDAPVQHYIPWFNVGNSPESGKITVRNLLNQTSGIPTYAGAKALAADNAETIEQRVHELSTVPLTKPVGERFQYSEDNAIVLSLIVQIVSGQPFGQYLQDHIFAPLQMKHSFVDQNEAERNGMAQGYRWWFGLPVAATLPYPTDVLGASFIISSAEDMTHYLIAQLNGGNYAKTSILSPDGVAELHRPVAPIGTGDRYAMGWVVGTRNGVPVIWHGGDTANFHADVVLVPERQWGIVILDNVNNALIQAEELGKVGRIAAGVTRMASGSQPADDVLSVNTFYWIFDALALLLLILQTWSLLRILRRRSAIQESLVPHKRFLYWLPLSWELALPCGIIVLLIGLLKTFDVPLSLLVLYAPDFSYWLLLMLCLLTGTAVLRLIRPFVSWK
jgi:CubicO group peptidase (beta-lactamase class C family)